MKALVFDDYGKKPEVREVPVPTPAAGEVLVRMCAASVNPFDIKLMSGSMNNYLSIHFPFVPGTDGAGVVEQVGSDVRDFMVGDEVFGVFSPFSGGGSFAEYALADVNGRTLSMKPTALDFSSAAAIPQSGLTAKTMFRSAELFGGERVLIIGATGGIGMFLVQMCSEVGANVIATAAGPDDADYVQRLGAKEIFDYETADVVGEVGGEGGVDVVFDLISHGNDLIGPAGILRSGGKLISPLSGPDAGSLGRPDIRVKYEQMSAQIGELQDLGRRAADRRLHVEVGASYTLEAADRAMAAKSRHIRGKIVITIA